jgi:hypothetical protein
MRGRDGQGFGSSGTIATSACRDKGWREAERDEIDVGTTHEP